RHPLRSLRVDFQTSSASGGDRRRHPLDRHAEVPPRTDRWFIPAELKGATNPNRDRGRFRKSNPAPSTAKSSSPSERFRAFEAHVLRVLQTREMARTGTRISRV